MLAHCQSKIQGNYFMDSDNPLTSYHVAGPASLILSLAGMLYAQTPAIPNDLSQIILNASSTALLGWYMWYTVCKVLPAKDKAQAEQMAQIRAEHRETIKEAREQHKEAITGLAHSIQVMAESVKSTCAYRPIQGFVDHPPK